MVRLADTKQPPRSNYALVFGNDEVGSLITRIHAASIKGGHEIERLIVERARVVPGDLDSYLDATSYEPQPTLATQAQVKASKTLTTRDKKAPPDFVVFSGKSCYAVEMKIGTDFDTKKSESEIARLTEFVADNAPKISFRVTERLCSFTAQDGERIVEGLKGRFRRDQVLTGREFCELVGVNYEEIVREWSKHQQENLEYLVETLLAIGPVKEELRKRMRLQGRRQSRR